MRKVPGISTVTSFCSRRKPKILPTIENLRPEADHILVCTCMSRLHIANTSFWANGFGKGSAC